MNQFLSYNMAVYLLLRDKSGIFVQAYLSQRWQFSRKFYGSVFEKFASEGSRHENTRKTNIVLSL